MFLVITIFLLISAEFKFSVQDENGSDLDDTKSMVRICPNNDVTNLCLGVLIQPNWIIVGKRCDINGSSLYLYMGGINRNCQTGQSRIGTGFIALGEKYPDMGLIKVDIPFISYADVATMKFLDHFETGIECHTYCNTKLINNYCEKQISRTDTDVISCQKLNYQGTLFNCFSNIGDDEAEIKATQRYGSPVICESKLAGFITDSNKKFKLSPIFAQASKLQSTITSIIKKEKKDAKIRDNLSTKRISKKSERLNAKQLKEFGKGKKSARGQLSNNSKKRRRPPKQKKPTKSARNRKPSKKNEKKVKGKKRKKSGKTKSKKSEKKESKTSRRRKSKKSEKKKNKTSEKNTKHRRSKSVNKKLVGRKSIVVNDEDTSGMN